MPFVDHFNPAVLAVNHLKPHLYRASSARPDAAGDEIAGALW